MKASQLLGLGLLMTPWSSICATEPLNLTFERTGTDAASVTVHSDLDGVTASLVSVSHSLKAVSNTIVCPDVNGNTSPTITMQFTIDNLPAGWSFNNVGLDIHALNASGGNQLSNDGKNRHFNVSVTSAGTQLVRYTDLDPAAGIEGVRKDWDAMTASTVVPASPMDLTITVTKGTDNQGCFFGLEGITLSTSETTPVEPPVPPTPSNSKFYTIKWKNNTSDYMTEQPDGSIAIGDYAIYNKVFWEFIPTDNENCYHIRSVASGKYIGSCNLSPSSASRVQMSDTPVEYYVHLSAADSNANQGCYWMSSTDCDNYANEAAGARCLNKDGASSYVITWTSGVGNVGSYWTLTETENLYELRPFTPQPAIGNPSATYYIIDTNGRAYNHAGEWQLFNPTDADSQWYFVGTSNRGGGYQIVNARTNEPLNGGAMYMVADTDGSAPYHFIDADNNTLSLAGETNVTFTAARSKFALACQIYQIPCGPIGNTWIASVNLGDDFHYPMATVGNNNLNYGTVTTKPAKFSVLTLDAATVNPGTDVPVSITLNCAPAEDYRLIMFADWNRDGIFETSTELTCAQTANGTLSIPADAICGKTRLRLRLTNNGLTGADDDISGQVLDLMLNVAEASESIIDPIVKTNDSTRGTALWSNGVAEATANGNALFLYWIEGHRIVGVDSRLDAPAANMPRTLTAVFSANTAMSGVDLTTINTVNTKAHIALTDGCLTVVGDEATAIILFATNGRTMASGTNSLNVGNVAPGIYIAKAITANGVVSAKLKL